MRISDWSSDVCSSDLEAVRAKERVFSPRGDAGEWDFRDQPPEFWDYFNTDLPPGTHLRVHPLLHWTALDIWSYIDRQSVVKGKSVYVRVDLGGRLIIKKKHKH